ncbi:hypothetical protein ABPG74_020191 [Tetrahymena malaccensis]
MKSLDSGGCVSNLGASILFFTNTLFDSCWSGMFGGALYSSGINITDQIIIKNSKSKIGGGAFVGNTQCNVSGLNKIIFLNDSNTATISSQQYFICTLQQDYLRTASCDLFELDSIYQLNTELTNTEFYQVQTEVELKNNGYPFFLKEFNEDQSIGNLYNYIDNDYKQFFYNFEIPNAYYPYVLTSYSKAFDYGGCTGNIRYGCFNQTDACVRGMQQVLNQQSQQMQCKYCDFGTYSNEPTNNCEVCNINNFDECYANNSFLKQNYWRPQNTKYDDTYFCQLNQKSCNSKNRLGYGNDLCSEGYTGAQCLVCDINGEFWRGESYGRDFIRLLSQTILPNQ